MASPPDNEQVPSTRRLAVWQIAIAVLAVAAMACGLVIAFMTGEPAVSPGGTPGGAMGLTPTEGQATSAAESGIAWSPVVFRMGFSTFAGFAVGYALRSFMKAAIIAIGFFLLLLFGLEYAQVIDVSWATVEAKSGEAKNWIGRQTEGFFGFITGQLPSAGLATLGLVAGLKRR